MSFGRKRNFLRTLQEKLFNLLKFFWLLCCVIVDVSVNISKICKYETNDFYI